MADRSIRIGDLVRLVDQGALVLPDLNRPLDWHRHEVVTLLDSLFRRQPTGSIVLWETSRTLRGTRSPASAGGVVRRISTAIARRVSRGSRAPAVVLDGQKRLAGLYRALTRDPAVCVRFNLETQTFTLESGAIRSDPRWVDVGQVVGSDAGATRALWSVQRSLNIGMSDPRMGGYQGSLQRLAAIRHHAFPVELLTSDRFEDVSETIARINPHGGARHATEVAVARLAFAWPDAVLEGILETLHELEDQHFMLDAPLLMRALAVVSLRGLDLDDLQWVAATTAEEMARNWRTTRDALLRTVGFLGEEGFDSSAMVPHPAILLPLVGLFARRKVLSGPERAAMRYWFLRSVALGRYAQAGDHAVERDLYALGGERPVSGLLHVLEQQGTGEAVSAGQLAEAGPATPFFTLLFAAVRRAGGMDWVTGDLLRDTHAAGRRRIGARHIFPPVALRHAGVPGSEINEVANIVFVARPGVREEQTQLPAEYLPEVVTRLGSDALSRQFVPTDPDLWAVSRFADFLAARRRLVARGISDLLAAARPAELPPAPSAQQSAGL